MKLTNLINLMTVAATLVVAGTGCRKTTLGPTTIPGRNRPPGITDTMPPEGSGSGTTRPNQPIAPYKDPNAQVMHGPIEPNDPTHHKDWGADPSNPLGPQTIYFDYDKSAIKANEHSKLEAVVSYLQTHPEVALRIEGNCDERGTEEYNRSLGERRALAGREHLAQMGIDPSRIDTITYGEDKPADPGHTESAWSKNRRDDFIVLLPPK